MSRRPAVPEQSKPLDGDLPKEAMIDLRLAMLSVYYHAAGQRLELRGAPAVLLPPEVQPLPLGEALARLAKYDGRPDLLREAIWRVLRAIPVHKLNKTGGYPPELDGYLRPRSLSDLTELRTAYRRGASIFAAALVACRDQIWGEYVDLERLIDKYIVSDGTFSGAASLLLGEPAPKVLSRLADEAGLSRRPSRWWRFGRRREVVSRTKDEASGHGPTSISEQLKRIERDVGLPLYDFVVEMADAAACYKFFDGTVAAAAPGRPTVYPVSSIIIQDSKTLTTTSTVTTLVKSKFEPLNKAIDPQNWSWSSDIIESAKYVAGPFDFGAPDPVPTVGEGYEGSRYLYEHAVVSWGIRDLQQGEFENVLNVQHKVGRGSDPFISLNFSLCRSVESRVLWDTRPGGIQLDEGFIKVRSLGQDRWRVTRQKVVRFSDRTPYANGPGWLDLGEMLNYLTPTALTWWLETETYSLGDQPPRDRP